MMRHSSEIHLKFVNRSVGLIQGSFILSECVKICEHDYIRDVSLTPLCRKLKLDKTFLATLRTWSSLSNRIKGENAKKGFFISEKQKKIDCFKIDGYCGCFITIFEAICG